MESLTWSTIITQDDEPHRIIESKESNGTIMKKETKQSGFES